MWAGPGITSGGLVAAVGFGAGSLIMIAVAGYSYEIGAWLALGPSIVGAGFFGGPRTGSSDGPSELRR